MMMKRELELQEIKYIELRILDHIHSICEKYDIKYFISYGTLLGAIRHKGFIPWDDDIDIVMSRPDFEKFKKVFCKEEQNIYSLKTPEDKDYCYEFSKVVDESTYVEEEAAEGSNLGVWVDIFPLDGLNKSDKIQEKLLYFLQRCRVASVYKKVPNSGYLTKPFMYIFWKICKCIGAHTIIDKIVLLSQKYKYEDCDFVGFAPTIHSKNKYMPKTWFLNQVDLQFEDRIYKGPDHIDEYLTSLYGDYMQLPPEEKRIPHKVKAYYK